MTSASGDVNSMKGNDLLEPFNYIASSQKEGDTLQSLLVEAFNAWMVVPHDKLEHIKKIVFMLHNASLLVDDIEDGSKMRQGAPVAHNIYGLPSTLNCANLIYFMALEHCLKLDQNNNDNSMRATAVFIEELLSYHRGQGQEINWRESAQCPSEEEYRSMVTDKTGGILRLGMKLMQLISQNNKNYTPLVNLLALYVQLISDYINLDYNHQQNVKNKSVCEDITEGKFSLPIIHSVHRNPEDHRLLNILKRRTSDEELKKYASNLIRTNGSFDYTITCIDQLLTEISQEILALGGNDKLMHIVNKLRASI
eukprot:TRINITY_DN11818_c0_g1_i1.p1 TRINITY_DN11818_c0_g1~~TRINITY_DN11818_c0_g1_i1.p1  ORF type:complete len:310 (+),score=116.44 TRINITY_DN11818_c0_g1_i1:68-997(+)